MTQVTSPTNIDTSETLSKEAKEMTNRIRKDAEMNAEEDVRSGLTSMWGKAKGYAKRASSAVSKGAKKVQARSAQADAQAAADRTERFMAGITATLTGAVKYGAAVTVGGLKGTLTGSARGTNPAFVKSLHAADDISLVGSWAGSVRQIKRDQIPHDVADINIHEQVAEQIGANPNGYLPLGRAVETHMEIEGRRRSVIVSPLYDDKTKQAIGCLVLEFDDDGEDRVFLHIDPDTEGEG